MAQVHRVAAQGFGSQAEAYDRARPGYPPDAVAWCVEQLGIRPGRRVLDLAAGTGKRPRCSPRTAPTWWRPSRSAGCGPGCRRAPAAAGGRRGRRGAAVPDTSLDAVTVAQAFHWFDGPAAMAELGRVVRPGGRMALLWNARDRSVDWVDQVWAVMDRVEHHAPWRDHGDGRNPDRVASRRPARPPGQGPGRPGAAAGRTASPPGAGPSGPWSPAAPGPRSPRPPSSTGRRPPRRTWSTGSAASATSPCCRRRSRRRCWTRSAPSSPSTRTPEERGPAGRPVPGRLPAHRAAVTGR